MKSEPGVCAEGPNDAWKQGRAEERLEDKDMGYRGRGYERGRGEERELKEEEWEVIRAMRERGSMGMGGGPFIYNPVIYGPQGQPPIPLSTASSNGRARSSSASALRHTSSRMA